MGDDRLFPVLDDHRGLFAEAGPVIWLLPGPGRVRGTPLGDRAGLGGVRGVLLGDRVGSVGRGHHVRGIGTIVDLTQTWARKPPRSRRPTAREAASRAGEGKIGRNDESQPQRRESAGTT
ncbi:hypothetical protein Ait01nite_082960 [Actinoplanes italicus]|nr:hypothetical protein Ait01nite_082960 [Actinoplanes italicus]